MLPHDILVPIDFSEGSGRALAYACEIASTLPHVTIHLVHATGANLPEANTSLGERAMADLREGTLAALEQLRSTHPGVTFGPCRGVSGDACDVVNTTAASVRADLIVMGTNGRRGVARLVLGSVAEHVVRTAPCPVLTIRDAA